LSRIWNTRPLPEGPLRDRLIAACRHSRAPVREILVWHTGDRIVNAAVAGFVRRWRYIFLTDSLLRLLTQDQIEAVTAHEIGHIRHRHLWLRMLAIAAPIAVFFGASAQFADVMSRNSWQWDALQWIVCPVIIGLYAIVIFGPYSRQLEHQADLFACGEGSLDSASTERYCTALERLSSLAGSQREKSTWLHPSTALRVVLLHLLGTDPALVRGFHHRLQRFNQLLLGSAIVGLLLVLIAG
jgi:STE24 endopeptidase